MLIVSKFKDYYDSIQRYGVDKSVVYQRKESFIGVYGGDSPLLDRYVNKDFDDEISCAASGVDVFWAPFKAVRSWSNGSTWGNFKCNIEEVVVGFCGVVQPLLEITYGTDTNYYGSLYTPKTAFVYSIEELDKLVDSFPKAARDAYHGKKKSKKERCRKPDPEGYIHNFERVEVAQYFKIHTPKEDSTLFLKHKVPIIVLKKVEQRRTAMILNASLRKIGYMKVLDPYLAYQKIAQYISGVLGVGEPETIEISDEDMRDKKGFFDMSFKKDPGVKKPRRRGKNRGKSIQTKT